MVFDVEGVLIPRNRLFFDVARTVSAGALLKVLFIGFLYQLGLIRLKSALTRIFRLMKGVSVDRLVQTLENLPRAPNAEEVFKTLNSYGYKTALISSGLPTLLVENLAAKVGADYAVGVEMGVKDNTLTGEVWGDVTETNGKYLVLKELMENEQVSPAETAVVVDDRNNASILLKDALKIGYDPDFIVRTKVDAVVTGSLKKILPIIGGNASVKRLPTSKDLFREFIHSSGFFIPILAIFFGVPPVAGFICIVIGLYAASELARIRGLNMPFFSAVTRLAASHSELCEFTMAPIYFGAGILLTLLLFPAPASYAAIAIFTLGDSAASLFGGSLSKKPLPFNGAKTAEGTAAGFLFGFLAGCVFISPWLALAGAAVGMFVEYLPLPINDNLLMPITTGLLLSALL